MKLKEFAKSRIRVNPPRREREEDMKNIYKAMEAIERLVGGGFGMDMEWLTVEKQRGKKIDKRLLAAAEVITEIYCIAHAENKHPCTHEAWESKKYEILKQSEE